MLPWESAKTPADIQKRYLRPTALAYVLLAIGGVLLLVGIFTWVLASGAPPGSSHVPSKAEVALERSRGAMEMAFGLSTVAGAVVLLLLVDIAASQQRIAGAATRENTGGVPAGQPPAGGRPAPDPQKKTGRPLDSRPIRE